MERATKFDIATLWETKRQNDLFWRSVLAYGNYEDKIALATVDSLSKSEQEQISSLLGHIESVIPQNYLYDSARQEHYPFYELSYREIDRQSYNSILIHYPGTNIDDPEYIVVATDLKQVKIPFLENIVQYYVPQAGTLYTINDFKPGKNEALAYEFDECCGYGTTITLYHGDERKATFFSQLDCTLPRVVDRHLYRGTPGIGALPPEDFAEHHNDMPLIYR